MGKLSLSAQRAVISRKMPTSVKKLEAHKGISIFMYYMLMKGDNLLGKEHERFVGLLSTTTNKRWGIKITIMPVVVLCGEDEGS